MGRAAWPVGKRLLQRDCQNGRKSARRVPQPKHEVLGNSAAARRPASGVARGLDADSKSVSAAIFGRDVFRLRRRLLDCRFRKAGARRVPGECSDKKIINHRWTRINVDKKRMRRFLSNCATKE